MNAKNILFGFAFCSSLSLWGQQEHMDSTIIRQLNEVVVEGQLQYVKSDVTTYVPTKNQKASAMDAIDLLSQMSIPQISVNPVDGTVKTHSRQNIAIYIDKQPATEQELNGLRTEDISKVDYYVFPTDPMFQHAPYVINFVLHKKEYGGYTKLSASGNILAGSCSELAYAKMAYKKMTYDIHVNDKYTDRHHNGTEKLQVFHFPDFNTRIARYNKIDHSRLQRNNFGSSFRAKYVSKDVIISNTISLAVNNTPTNENIGKVFFIPDISVELSYSDRKEVSGSHPKWDGNFFFNLGKGYDLSIISSLQYQHIKNNRIYSVEGEESIITKAKDNGLTGRMNIQLNKTIFNTHTIDINGYLVYNYDKVKYSGTSNSSETFRQGMFGAIVGYTIMNSKFYGRLEGGVVGEWNKINSTQINDIFPLINLNSQYAFNSHNSLDFTMMYATNSASQADKSPNVLQENEFLYKTGNPRLKDNRWMSADITYTWLPNNIFSITASGGWSRYYDRPVPVFTPIGPDGMMLRSIENDGDCQNIDFGVSVKASMLNKKLTLSASPRMWFSRLTGIYSQKKNYLDLSFQASYYLKKFYFTAFYSSGLRGVIQYSMDATSSKGKSSYQFRFGWRSGNWNIRVTAVDIFRRDWVSGTSKLESKYFEQYNTLIDSSRHQFISLSATYTIGFGKKIRRGDEIDPASEVSSAIMQ